jgi:hypothetical protein
MRRIVRGFWWVLPAALLWLGWRVFFPGDERRILRLLNDIAQTVSVPEDGKFVGGVLAVERLRGCLAPGAEVAVDLPGQGRFHLTGREELLQAYMAARSNYRGVKVEFCDIQVTVAPDHDSAVADLTGRATHSSGELHVQELRVNLVRADNRWCVRRVETTQSIQF